MRQQQPRGQHAARIEAGIDALHEHRASNEQSRSDQQRDGERHLGGNEYSAHPVARDAALSSPFAHRALQSRTRGRQRWNKPEEQAAHDAEHQREREDAPVDCGLFEPRNVARD